MGQPAISSDHLTVHLWLHEKVLALHGSVSVPLLAITAIEAHPVLDLVNEMEGGELFRGTHIPGRMAIGTDYKLEEKAAQGPIFFDVHDKDKAVAVTLDDQRFKRLVFSVDDPEHWVQDLRLAVNRARQKAGWNELLPS